MSVVPLRLKILYSFFAIPVQSGLIDDRNSPLSVDLVF